MHASIPSLPFDRWRRRVRGCCLAQPIGFHGNIAFALVAGYLGIIVGRWVLGCKNL